MSLKITEYPLHQLICLGRLEIYIALLKSQPVHIRILPQSYCVSIVGLLTRRKLKKTQTPGKSSKKLNEWNDFLLFC